MPSFWIPLTGLESSSEALNTIANNLANMNTTGYKAETAQFSDLFYQQLGTSGNDDPEQFGTGTQIGATTTDFTTGSPTSTGVSTNVAIDGDGFFVLQNSSGYEYSRDGDFSLTSDGYLISDSGLQVMGYPAVNGAINTGGTLSAIQIPVGSSIQPKASTEFSVTANLDSGATVGTSFPADVTLYDSLGNSYQATITFTNTGTNAWSYSIALPSGDASGGTNLTGNLTFDSSGNLTSPTSDVTGITFTGLSDGASNMSLDWNLYNSAGTSTLTQYSGGTSGSTQSAQSSDGYASGEYSSMSVSADGVISVTYSNQQTLDVGQLAMANVVNDQGLERLGDNNYATTSASGQATDGVAGTAGLGTLDDDALEASNVDISTQFSNLIVAQQLYEANSKTVTTFDTISQDTINMIH
ncbi:flagellar hook protein FlgE [Silvibacterium sp.]|uniref:flagellar hook protein FlgE n=1 Tax=Silvibacterium sp. TaxID=1964179 RepID=UPI0039E4C3A8